MFIHVHVHTTAVVSRVIVGVHVDTAVAESAHPLHTHQSIDVEEEEVVEGHIEQLLPPGERGQD